MVATGRALLPLWPPPDPGLLSGTNFSSLSCSRSLLLPSASTQGKLLVPRPSCVCTAAQGDRAWKLHGRRVPGGAVIPDCSFCFQPLSPISGWFSFLHLILPLDKAARSWLSLGRRMFQSQGCSRAVCAVPGSKGSSILIPAGIPQQGKTSMVGLGASTGCAASREESRDPGRQGQSWAVEHPYGIQGWIQLPFLAGGIPRHPLEQGERQAGREVSLGQGWSSGSCGSAGGGSLWEREAGNSNSFHLFSSADPARGLSGGE